MTIRIALGVALVLAASVPARAAARFLVGASAADITPPLAATAASNPADCDASGLYNGAHLFSLEEPYYKKVYVNGVEQPQAPNGSEQGNQVKTDLGWFMIGDAEFVTTPGELFPFTYVHDFSGARRPARAPVRARARLGDGDPHRPLALHRGSRRGHARLHLPALERGGGADGEQPESGRHRPLRLRALGRRRGRGRGRGDLLNDALLALLPAPTRFDQVQVGRYVWSDGTLHRDPTGTGRHGCDATNAVFTPAPDGGAVGVWVLPPGVSEFAPGVGKVYLVRDSSLGPGRRTLRFLDVNGRPRRGRAHRRAASGVASAGTSGSTCSPTRQGSRCSRRADLRGGRRWCGAARHAGP